MKSSLLPGQRSLGTLMAGMVAAMTVVLVASLLALTVPIAVGKLDDANGARLGEMAALDRDRLDESLYERYHEVRGMAQRLSGDLPWDSARAALDAMQRAYPYYAWIGLADAQGRVRAATQGVLDGVDVSQRPWFSEGLRGGHLSDVHEALLLAKALGQKGPEPLRFFDISFPVRRGGAVVGVLGAHLYWEWSHQLRSVMERAGPDGSAPEPVLLSEGGLVLMGPPGLEGRTLDLPSYRDAMRNRGGHVVERWPDGRTYLVGYARSQAYNDSPGLGWVVLMRQDIDVARAPVHALERSFTLGGLALCLAFGLLAAWAARRMARPVLQLAGEAQAIGRGELGELRAGADYREVGMLAEAFNALLRSLRQREQELREANQGLELRVSERTRELQGVLRRSTANEERLRLLVETSPDAFLAVDTAGCITEWNARAAALFQRGRAEVLGQPATQVLRSPDGGEALLERMRRSALQPVRGGEPRALEATLLGADGVAFPAELRCALAEAGDAVLLTAFIQDIGARKALEGLKDQFIGTVTHELRTPTAAISGSLELMQRLHPPAEPTAARLLDNAVHSARRLSRLITDVLWVEQAAAGKMAIAPVAQPLLPLLDQAVAEAAAYAQPHGVALAWTAREPCTVALDADRMVQVVLNLLSNAVKFSPRGGTVELALRHGPQLARITVTDHGPGIPPEFQCRVFERFAQHAGSGQAAKGSGLGLAISRGIVAAHGGHIGFESEPGVRTTFFVELPLVQGD